MVEKAADTAVAPPWIFHREIDFVPAKRQFTGFSNGGGGFRLETLNPTKSDPNKLGKGPEPEVSNSKELELDHKLSFGFSIMKIGAGLENLGNTCYLNSVLQCLTYTEPLAASLQSGRHKSSCRKAGFCALCAMQNHINRALQSTGKYLVPNDLVSNLRCISRNFQRQRMEDAHEYMVNLLESMHKCCLPSGVPSESPSTYEKSLVHQIFGGRLRSQVKCMQCSFCSDKFDPFLDLSLEINKADSLQKALSNFTAEEYLDEGAREYQCQRCNKKVKALKKLSIYKAPNVLSIHLKRFRRHQPGQTQKIDKKVHFGPTLDLKPFVSGPYDGDLKYTLYGVLVHKGWNIHSGHYYCFIRTASGIWHSLDDTTVTSVRENMVFDEKAYILFYVRDRKNVIPKKPVDVYAKSMIINGMGNRMLSSSNRVDLAVTCALKETLVKAEKNMSDASAIKPSCNVTLRDSDEKRSKIANSSSQVEEPSRVNIQIGGPSRKRMNIDGIKKLEKKTSIPTSQIGKKRRKLKKKISKSQITVTRLSSGIILGAALNVRKKIKKKAKKSALRIKNQGHDSNLVEAVATYKPQECISSSHLPRNDFIGGEENIVKESGLDSKQNGIMNMLTRGLEETAVAQWDEIENPSSQIAGRSGEKPLTIGYIGDDWDEEYDKGKRKKVKTSITEFGGPNPFQEIATNKAKFKNTKLKPFRTRGK